MERKFILFEKSKSLPNKIEVQDQSPSINVHYSQEKKLKSMSHLESFYMYDLTQENNDIDKWFSIIETIAMDFSRAAESKCKLSEIFENMGVARWKETILQIDLAVTSYSSALEEKSHIKPISDKSALFLLYLVPSFAKHDPSVSIDADTGYFNATFKSHDKGLMTVLISDHGELYYSLAERGRKIVKISGSAKVKDPHDLMKFNKVLSMLC